MKLTSFFSTIFTTCSRFKFTVVFFKHFSLAPVKFRKANVYLIKPAQHQPIVTIQMTVDLGSIIMSKRHTPQISEHCLQPGNHFFLFFLFIFYKNQIELFIYCIIVIIIIVFRCLTSVSFLIKLKRKSML